ncbi:MAG: methyltransferase domain-containing protein [Candidatus Coatesbacteria bacterium]|nr:methyltransferase domain-containing protein [Candidatus Coatesbacteria bacterium]
MMLSYDEQFADCYDLFYLGVGKDYADEVERLLELLDDHDVPRSGRLLDAACGTGLHLQYLREHFDVEGFDLSPAMLDRALKRLPDVPLHRGDLVCCELGRRFDVVCCLFGSIGYVLTTQRLRACIANLASHLAPGGVLVVEPWLTPESFKPGRPGGMLVEEEGLKLARMTATRRQGRVSILELHFLLNDGAEVRYFVNRHELGLFSREEMEAAFTAAGLRVEFDEAGLDGRGLYLGFMETD